VVLRDRAEGHRSRPGADGWSLTASTAAREFLEALGLEPRLPDARFFEDLFLRFQKRVAYETLTQARNADARGGDPEEFLECWSDEEPGLVGIERTLVFLRLSRDLGFDVRLVRGTCRRPFVEEPHSSRVEAGGSDEHAAIVASLGGREVLADLAYPLPVLLPLDPAVHQIPSPWGKLAVKDERTTVIVEVDGQGALTEAIRLERAPAEEHLPVEARFPGLSPFFPGPSALRLHDDRVLYWSRGTMTVLDAWSRLTYPLAFSEKKTLEALFGLNLQGVDHPAAAAADRPPVLTVYHESPLSPEDVRRGLSAETAELSLVARRELFVEPTREGSRIVLRATLSKRVPPAGPGEAVRKTLVFHLASRLLALSR
jgi:hypothetical protein